MLAGHVPADQVGDILRLADSMLHHMWLASTPERRACAATFEVRAASSVWSTQTDMFATR
jgi:hypothetical protein